MAFCTTNDDTPHRAGHIPLWSVVQTAIRFEGSGTKRGNQLNHNREQLYQPCNWFGLPSFVVQTAIIFEGSAPIPVQNQMVN